MINSLYIPTRSLSFIVQAIHRIDPVLVSYRCTIYEIHVCVRSTRMQKEWNAFGLCGPSKTKIHRELGPMNDHRGFRNANLNGMKARFVWSKFILKDDKIVRIKNLYEENFAWLNIDKNVFVSCIIFFAGKI